jgi:predicted phage tail protein|tara:strand:- start:72 stop:680 length:609 start_codon:yes stop_codon:yes gene_type:complete
MQLKKIKVYGKLRQFLGKSYFEAAVKSPQQAISFLMANFEGLQKHMNDQIYKIKMGNTVISEDLFTMSGQGDIKIIPVATGSGPVIPIIGGLIGTGFAAEIGTFVAANTFLSAKFVSGVIATVGTNMLIGGVTDLIAPVFSPPNNSEVSEIDPKIRGSYTFSGIQNVNTSGVPVPILYGLVFSGSILISSGTDTAQVRQSIS